MSLAEIVRPIHRGAAATFGPRHQEQTSYRLPPGRIRELQEFFCGAESAMGLRTGFAADLAMWAGLRPGASGVDFDVELVGAERWCVDRRQCRVMARTRAALMRLDSADAWNLLRVYGPRPPGERSAFPPEIAPLALQTRAVETRRIEMRDRLAAKRIQEADAVALRLDREADALLQDADRRPQFLEQEIAWLSRDDEDREVRAAKLERQRQEATEILPRLRQAARSQPPRTASAVRAAAADAIRRGADAEVTRTVALEAGLALPDEGKLSKEERLAARGRRKLFVDRVVADADALLERASEAYRDAWESL